METTAIFALFGDSLEVEGADTDGDVSIVVKERRGNATQIYLNRDAVRALRKALKRAVA